MQILCLTVELGVPNICLKKNALKTPPTFPVLWGRDYKNLVRNIFAQAQDSSVHTNTSATELIHLDSGINSQRGHPGAQSTLPMHAGNFDLLSGLGFAERHQDALRT